MPLDYNYKKNFIILREEEKGYQIASGKNPTGYVKIEFKKDKVNINGFVQNVAASEKSDYELLLLNPMKKHVFKVGNLRMGYSGGGEINRKLDQKDISEIDDHSLAVVITGDKVILFGSNTKGETGWKEWFYDKYLHSTTPESSMASKEEEVAAKNIILSEPEKTMIAKDISTSEPKEPIIVKDISTSEPKEPIIVKDASTSEPEKPIIAKDISTSEPKEPIIVKDISTSEPKEPVIVKDTSTFEPEKPIIAEDASMPELKELTENLATRDKGIIVETECCDKKVPGEEVIKLSIEELSDKTDIPEKVLSVEENFETIEFVKAEELEDIGEVMKVINEEKQKKTEMLEDLSSSKLIEVIDTLVINDELASFSETEKDRELDYKSVEAGEKIIYELAENIYIDSDFKKEDQSKCQANIDAQEGSKERAEEVVKKNNLAVLINRLRKIEGVESKSNRQWYAIDDNINLLGDIAIMLFGGKVPLSYLYLAEGCSIMIKNSILGIESCSGKIVKIFIGIPGLYNKFWQTYFRSKGFTEYIRSRMGQQGYWVLGIDLEEISKG